MTHCFKRLIDQKKKKAVKLTGLIIECSLESVNFLCNEHLLDIQFYKPNVKKYHRMFDDTCEAANPHG